MIRENPARVALAIVAAVLGGSVFGSVARAESFDKPLREKVVDLGPSPYLMPRNKSRIQLFCSYYPDFMVKQLNNPGQKGTRWVTIVLTVNGNIPACRRAHDPSERFIAKEWWSFVGAKGQLLFLEAADGSSGGMPFRVLDMKTGKKIFEDSVWWKSHLEFAPTSDGKITLGYLRLVEGDCSIPKDGMSCWSKFRRRYGLAPATVPKCTGYRHEGDKEWVVGDEGVPTDKITTASAIAYPVVVEHFPQPSIRAVPGELECSPVE